ncbi:hypothetical protein HMPREF1624_07930 [Sporothrix schenckii ATCC 58251]|uniref:C2H2-type domain-containing protein n=1 Tax=Sporothrix schenckii (strain ATCC 58251 / de Perez 2211183) TaxID=1391915 RepID=U7PJM4_SPOS1|nr:hypothetical protein HMPREF1624_07930 [Sporothrix schenckii ATCC 58251]
MDKQTHMYDVLGKRRPGVMKAVVAARYENASQTFNKLCSNFIPFAQLLPQTETQHQALDDAFARLTIWGHETGAEDHTLDYKLRKSKDLHDTVVEALQELQVSLDEALQLLEDEKLQQWSSRATDDQADRSLPPVTVIPDNEDGTASRDELIPGTVDGASLDDAQTADLLEALSDVFDFIGERVENLIMLGPSLDRPYPQDIDTYSSSISNTSDVSDQLDIERAKLEFPTASNILKTRLGRANWKRRVSQAVVQEQIQQDGKVHITKKGSKKPHHHDVAQDAFNFQKPTLKPERRQTVPKVPMFLPLMSIAASSAAPSETASIFDVDHTVAPKLTRAESATTMATMATFNSKKLQMSGSSMLGQPPAKAALFPRPPLQLTELPKGKTQMFTCNFCGYDLEAGGKIKTEEDWNEHLLEDLEPYLCTFDKCFSAQETYAQRDEWYRHELESHRIKKTWPCPACMKEFDTKSEASEHLVQTHCGELKDDKEVAMMKAMLRQTLSGQHVGTQICPLCGDKVEASACKDHIGRHLEYFALLAVANEDVSEEDDSDDIFSQSDDAMSERGRKEFVLNTFVTEQFKLNLERGKQPPDLFMDSSSRLDLLDDMSDYDGSKDSDSRFGGGHGETRQMLIDRMFQTGNTSGAAQQTSVGRTGETFERDTPARRMTTSTTTSQKTRQALQLAAKPPSLASSTEKMPLLRTFSSPRNSDFMGRDKELANLYKILSEPGRVCVVSGEGGMGKTALAVEYSWRFEQSYHYIFWVQAETPVGSSDTFSQIAQQLQLAPDGTDQDTLVRLGREFIEQIKDRRWLMVLDNVDRWEDIDAYMPNKTSATQGSILITTRHESLTAPSRPVNYYRVMLEELNVEEGRKLLIFGLPEELRPEEMSLRDPEYKVAGEIAGLIGLPLLIVYVSGYIKKSGCTLSEFWEYWNEWRPNAWMSANTTQGERQEPSTAGRESVLYVALRDLSSDEMKLLKIMAFLDSNGIQREVLEWNNPDQPGPTYLKKSRLRVIISKLKSQSIVSEREQGGREIYTVHRLLQSKLLQDMNANRDERDIIFGIAYELIRNRLPRPSLDTPEQAKWNAFKEYLPHVLSLQRAYADPLSIVNVKPFLGLAELFKDGGVLLWQRYIHGDALRLLRSAERVLDQLPQSNENLRSEINITINLLLQYFGISHRKEIKERSAKILEYRQSMLTQRPPESVTNEDKLVLNNARADYANTLLQFNDFRKAEPIYEECLAIYTEIGKAEDGGTAFAIAKLHHHLAYCKMYRRQFDEALALSNKAVRIIESVSDMAMALRYRFDLACIMLQSGNLQQALDMHQDILKARLGFQGRASYFTLQSQYAVAALCHYLGRLEDAEILMQSALSKAASRGGKNFWPDAAVARTKYHLSLIMTERIQADGENEQTDKLRNAARKLAFEAKDVLSRMLPYDPDTITGVREEDTLALFDHLQPVFGGRFTSTKLLGYVSHEEE